MTKRTNRDKKKRKTVKKGGAKQSDFTIGDEIIYHSFTNPEHNGKKGKIVGFHESDRVQIKFEREFIHQTVYVDSITKVYSNMDPPEADVDSVTVTNEDLNDPELVEELEELINTTPPITNYGETNYGETNYIKIKDFHPTNPIHSRKSPDDILDENPYRPSVKLQRDFIRNSNFHEDILLTDKCFNNSETSVKIVSAHGRLLENEAFYVPPGVKIITLSPTDICIEGTKAGTEIIPLLRYYQMGKTIFKDNDKNKYELSSDMDQLKEYYMALGEVMHNFTKNSFNYRYALHLKDDLISDNIIQFRGRECHKENQGGFDCGIICFEKGNDHYYNFRPESSGMENYKHYGNNQYIRLSELVHQIKGTIILFTCRELKTDSGLFDLHKTISKKGTIRLGEQDQSVPKENKGKNFTLSTEQPDYFESSMPQRVYINKLEKHEKKMEEYMKYLRIGGKINMLNKKISKENEELKKENEELENENIELENENIELKKEINNMKKKISKIKKKTKCKRKR